CTEPAPGAADAASCFSHASVPAAISVKPGGGWTTTNPFVMLTPYTSAPAFTAIAPAEALVVDEPNPESERCPPNASAYTAFTPRHAVRTTPPSVIGAERLARTARIESWFGWLYASGKCCTFVSS